MVSQGSQLEATETRRGYVYPTHSRGGLENQAGRIANQEQ